MPNVAWSFTSDTSFVYDATKPTLQTEKLSFQLLQHLAAISGQGGFSAVTSAADMVANEANIDNYVSSLQTWLTDCFEKLSTYLLSNESSRGVLALASPPAIVLAGGSLAMLPPAALAKLVTGTISDITRSFTELQGSLRKDRVTRLIDKAFFNQSWFGDTFDTSYLSQIVEKLDAIDKKLSTTDVKTAQEINVAEVIKRAFSAVTIEDDGQGNVTELKEWFADIAKKQSTLLSTIRLLSKIYISTYGELYEADFTLADGES